MAARLEAECPWLPCQFPAVAAPTTVVASVSRSCGDPVTLSSNVLPVTVQPTPVRITSLTGPTTIEQGRLVTYAYAYTRAVGGVCDPGFLRVVRHGQPRGAGARRQRPGQRHHDTVTRVRTVVGG